jgi:hypothetical protein
MALTTRSVLLGFDCETRARKPQTPLGPRGIVSFLQSRARVDVLIPQPIQPRSTYYARRQSQPAVPCSRNEVKVNEPRTAQSEKNQRYSQVYRSMQPTHKVKLARLDLRSRPTISAVPIWSLNECSLLNRLSSTIRDRFPAYGVQGDQIHGARSDRAKRMDRVHSSRRHRRRETSRDRPP